jgi:hypothetical protein
MSWSIYKTGTKEAVRKAITDFKPTCDETQVELAKSLILSEIDFNTSEFENGIKVEASGSQTHTSGNGNRSNININVTPINLVI